MSAAVSPLEAALALNLPQLRSVTSTLSAAELLRPKPGGVNLVHGVAASLFFFKAGEVSSLVPWPNASRTVYAQDVRRALSRAIRPVLRNMISKAPPLATAADAMGATPLHIACKVCADDVVEELLRAGARPDAQTHFGRRRTPIDEAVQSGCIEVLGLLLRALGARSSAAQQAALLQAVRYARLPGAALPPPSMLLSHPHMRAAVAAPILASVQSAARQDGPGTPGTYPSGGLDRQAPRVEPAPTEPSASCAEGGGWDVEAPPSQAERETCEIDQLSSLAAQDFESRFYSLSRPVLIRGALPLIERCAYARQAKAMAAGTATQPMRCGRTAYPSLTGQKPCGVFSLDKLNTHAACTDVERTLPVCAMKPLQGVNITAPFASLPTRFRYEDHLPPDPTLGSAWRRGGSRQLFAGGRGSGAALHFHNPAYNVQFFGVKRWLLTPPRHSGITGAAMARPEWAAEQAATRSIPSGLPLRCTQGPGDMLLLPGHWGHATINSGFAIGIGNLYCDTLLANYTHDPSCHRFYPGAAARPRKAKLVMATILREALGGTFAKDGAYKWPRDSPSSALSAVTPPEASGPAFVKTVGFRGVRGAAKRGRGLGRRRSLLEASMGGSHGNPTRGSGAPRPSRGRAPMLIQTVPPRPGCVDGQPGFRTVAFVHINKVRSAACLPQNA